MPNSEQELNDISLIARRRTLAVNEFWRAGFTDGLDSTEVGLNAAIESATTVTITPALIRKVYLDTDLQWKHEAEDAIRVVLAAAGFEVKP